MTDGWRLPSRLTSWEEFCRAKMAAMPVEPPPDELPSMVAAKPNKNCGQCVMLRKACPRHGYDLLKSIGALPSPRPRDAEGMRGVWRPV